MKVENLDIPYLISMDKIGSFESGFISIAEKLPFEIKRVYWTYNTPHAIVRGRHAHKELVQIIFSLNGTIKLDLENIAGDKYHFTLKSPEEGLYIPKLHWRTIQFSHNAVLLCLASQVFDRDDYIRDYTEFKNLKF